MISGCSQTGREYKAEKGQKSAAEIPGTRLELNPGGTCRRPEKQEESASIILNEFEWIISRTRKNRDDKSPRITYSNKRQEVVESYNHALWRRGIYTNILLILFSIVVKRHNCFYSVGKWRFRLWVYNDKRKLLKKQ